MPKLSNLLASLPIIIFLYTILVLKWNGLRASVLAWFLVIIISVGFFQVDISVIQYAHIKSLFISFDILLIIWSALYLHKITEKAGTIQKLGLSISRISNSKQITSILLGWLFPSFLQGVGGFGVPVAICAPLLLSAGFSPVQSVVIPSIGHAWSITFGSMGSAFQALSSSTNIPAFDLVFNSGLILGIVAIVCGFLVIYLSDGKKRLFRFSGFVIILGSILGFGQYFISSNGYWTIAVAISTIISIMFALLYMYLKDKPIHKSSRESENMCDEINNQPSLFVSIFPYGLIVLLSLLIDLYKPIHETLGKVRLSLQFPEMASINHIIIPQGSSRQIQIFSHPGTVIFFSAMIAYILYKKSRLLEGYQLKGIFKEVVDDNINPSLTLIFMASIALMMDHAQFLFIIAEGISALVGGAIFPFLSPFIGAIGAFITGSNTNSNMLFAPLQFQMAKTLGINHLLVLGLQTAGGAIGSIVAPAKVVVACSTVNLFDRQYEVFRKLLLYCFVLILFIGLLGYLIIKI